jgi:HK97 family phage major capsid protein
MPETYTAPTPDDLPEAVLSTGGIQASIPQAANDALARLQARRAAQQAAPAPAAASSGSTADVLVRANAIIERSRALRASLPASQGQGGSAPRRAVGPEAGTVQAALNEVHRALADMRGENELHEADRRRGRADPVRAGRIARTDDAIDAAERQTETLHRQDSTRHTIEAMARTMDIQARQISALRRGRFAEDSPDASGRRIAPAARRHTDAIQAFMRNGDDSGLRRVQASMTTEDDTGGGYFIPEEWDRTITRLLTQSSVMRQIATVRPISGPMLKMPKNLGGANAGWIGERTAPTETDTSTFAELLFTVMELYAEPWATQQLLEDGNTDLESWLAEEVREAMAALERPAFITGTGANQPRGLLSYTMVADASWSWGKFGYIATGVSGDWAATNPQDVLLDVEYALHPDARTNASWLINRSLIKEIRKWKDLEGNYIWQRGLQAGQPSLLNNYPVYEDDYMPVKGANSYSLGFGDWRSTYLILDRLGATLLRDPYTQKPYIKFYTRKRVGGGVKEFQRAKFLKFGTS